MKNHLLVIAVLAIFPILNCSYAQSCDTISLDTLTVEKYGQTFKNGTAVDFVYQFVYPTNNTPAIRRIREQMIQSFFNIETSMPLEQAQRHYEKEEMIETKYFGDSPCWNTTYSGIKISNNKVLSFFIQEYYYGGGPHSYEYSQCQCYDLQTGNRITLQDLFYAIQTDYPNDNELLCLINDQLYPRYNLETHFISHDFALLPQGVMFIYDLYDIGSYADGIQRVILPFSKIRHLLKPIALTYFENNQ